MATIRSVPESCLGWVRVEPQPPVLVRVFAHVAYDVKRSAALLKELNALNVRSRLATVCWAEGTVAVHSALPAEAVDRATLAAGARHRQQGG